MSARRGRALALAALLAVAPLAACSGSDDEAGTTTTTTAVDETATSDPGLAPEATPAPTACADAEPLEPGIVDGKPESVELPDVPPTDQVEATVLREGDGPEVTDASYVTVHYVGVACSTGAAFDSSWDRGEPITAALGTATPTATAFQVIPGWTDGLVGQKEGTLVQVDIPPSLGYGEVGAGGAIGPNEPLTFVIDIVTVSEAPPA